MFCRHCGKENSPQMKFCVYCGNPLPQQTAAQTNVLKFCRTCGAKLDSASGLCPNCQGGRRRGNSDKNRGGKTFLIVMICLTLLLALVAGIVWAIQNADGDRDDPGSTPSWTQAPAKDPGKKPGGSAAVAATDATEDPAEAAFQEVVTFCQEHEAEGEYLEIVRYLQELVRTEPDEERYEELLSLYEETLEEYALETAYLLIEEGEFKEAMLYIESVEEVITCEEFYGLVELCKGYLSQPLGWCPVVEDTNHAGTSSDVCLGDWEDVYGNYHYDSVRYWVIKQAGYQNTEYAVYRLDRAFETLTGEIVTEISSDAGSDAVIMIYLDGVLAYTSPTVFAGSGVVSFELDVTGVSEIKVLCSTESSSFNYCIVDAMLHEY